MTLDRDAKISESQIIQSASQEYDQQIRSHPESADARKQKNLYLVNYCKFMEAWQACLESLNTIPDEANQFLSPMVRSNSKCWHDWSDDKMERKPGDWLDLPFSQIVACPLLFAAPVTERTAHGS